MKNDRQKCITDMLPAFHANAKGTAVVCNIFNTVIRELPC